MVKLHQCNIAKMTIAITDLDQCHHIFVAPCIAALETENIFVRPQTPLVRFLQLTNISFRTEIKIETVKFFSD